MQTVLPDEFKRGMLLLLDKIPHLIENSHTSGTAQTRHKLHVRLRNLKTGNVIERTFAENERVPVGDLEHRTVQFSYNPDETGLHRFSLNGKTGTVNVEEAQTSSWLIGLILVLLIAIGAGIYLYQTGELDKLQRQVKKMMQGR